ncbi:hypothetical protein SUGI_1182560 [Cryptomeria japonica]|nr:hypothetical protein SUGI_1182560 [Cryptomeria japonica]
MAFQPSNEFDFSSFSSIPFQPEETYQNALDFCITKPSGDGFDNPNSSNVGKEEGRLTTKQIIHRMIERQRRKDINSLYSELRSLLPQERFRGKRSVPDQLMEAVNYVRYLKQQIKELTKKRDNNNNTRAVCSMGVEISKPPAFHEPDESFPSVRIKSLGSATFQVYINSVKNQIALSDILLVLEECRVEVVNAASSEINEKVFHTIYAKVTAHSITNIDSLYAKLKNLIG